MERPVRGPKEERAHTAGAGLPAAETPPAGGEAVPSSRGALAGGRAKERYPAINTPGGIGEEVTGRSLSGCTAAAGFGQRSRRQGGRG